MTREVPSVTIPHYTLSWNSLRLPVQEECTDSLKSREYSDKAITFSRRWLMPQSPCLCKVHSPDSAVLMVQGHI
jgi:hypothetical protein